MSSPRASRRLVVVIALFTLAALAVGFSSGPPAYMTNAPNEANCTVCHSSYNLNEGLAAGVATFELMAPDSIPGAAFPLTISPRFPATTRPVHGFQFTVRDSQDTALSPSYAGSISILDPTRTQFAFGDPRYVNHTFGGTLSTSWGVGWTPGALPPGPVTIYAVGNAANGNSSSDGDYIYSATHKLYQAKASSSSTTWAVGSVQTIDLEAPTVPGHVYALVASEDASIQTPLGGPFDVPLNVFSVLGLASLSPQFSAIFQNFVGTLGASGQATAAVVVPGDPALAGVQVHFAFATFDPVAVPSLVATEVSNRLTVMLQ